MKSPAKTQLEGSTTTTPSGLIGFGEAKEAL
jgi:hypothetical protein